MTSEATVAPDARTPSAQPKTLVEHLLAQVRGRADAPAIYTRSGGRWLPITWAQFGDGARRVASFLVDEGIKPGDHVAIWAGNRAEWHTADAAILLIRGCPVPVYQTLSADQAQYVLNHSQTRLVFVENEAILARVLQERDQLRHLRRVVVMEGVDDPSPDGFVVPWRSALEAGQESVPRNGAEIDARAAQTQMDDVVTLIYTSGTTGPPKAVMLTHNNIAASAQGLHDIVEVGPDDRVLSYLPLAHIAERMVSEFRSYRYGNATWFLDGLPNLGARLREVRPTHFFGVPRVWEKMAAQVRKQIAATSPVKRALTNVGDPDRATRLGPPGEGRAGPRRPAAPPRPRRSAGAVQAPSRPGVRRRPHPCLGRGADRPRGAALLPLDGPGDLRGLRAEREHGLDHAQPARALAHRHRRRGLSRQRGAHRRGRRDPGPRRGGLPGLPAQPGGDRGHARSTAGCRPATSASSTPTATCASPTARRT